MTDPTTAILDLIRKRGPMLRREIGGRVPLIHVKTARLAHVIEAATTSGTLREVEWRQPLIGSGDGSFTLLATPEQAAIMDVLREPDGCAQTHSTIERLLFPSSVDEALDTLLASGHVVRTERECERCEGKGWNWPTDEAMDAVPVKNGVKTAEVTCPHCTDGTVTVYELAKP